jgi:hypothetical protein
MPSKEVGAYRICIDGSILKLLDWKIKNIGGGYDRVSVTINLERFV